MPSVHESAARWLKLDELCDRFEAACLAGTLPSVEEFLTDMPAERRGETVRELLKVDAHYRQRTQDWPSVAEYRSRFPEIDSVWLRTLLAPPSSRALHESPGAMSARERFLDDPSVLPSVPGYEVLELIGRGGMGVVYKARQVNLNRLVALKMVLAGELAGPETLARFRAEARAVAQLQHPNLVQIYEVGEHHGRPYLAFEYVAGGGLDQRLRGEPQPPSAAARLIKTLAHAIQFAHAQGIVHRDLKPANILLATSGKPPTNEPRTAMLPDSSISATSQPVSLQGLRPNSSVENPTLSGGELAGIYGFPKISDFGLAKDLESDSQQTKTGAILGTPSYMAPEQATGRANSIGPATDVYALGAILYEMLTGRPPFRAPTVIETLDQVRSLEPLSLRRVQPTVPRDLDTICLKCLHKDPARRYASAAALADDLDRYLRDEPVLARPVNTTERTWRWCRRRPLAATVALLLFVVTCGGVGGIFHQWSQAETARELAEDNANAARRQRDEARAQRLLADSNRTLAEQNLKIAETNLASAESRFQKARVAVDALTKVGDDLLKQPQMESFARQVLETAIVLQESLLAEKSTDLATRLQTVRSLRRLGLRQRELGQYLVAEASMLRAIKLLDDLLLENKDDVIARRELRNVHTQMVHFYNTLDRTDAANRSFQEALRYGESLLDGSASDPDDQVNLANTLTNWAAHLGTFGHLEQAQAVLVRSIALLRPLAQAEPNNPNYQIELALALGESAAVLWPSDRETAEKHAREALAIRRQLQQTKPGSRDLSEYTSRSYQQVGKMCLDTGRDAETEALLQEAQDILQHAIALHPEHVTLRWHLIDNVGLLYKVFLKRGNDAGADSILRFGLLSAKQLVTELPESVHSRLRLAISLDLWANWQAKMGEKPSAAETYLAAIAEYKRVQDDAQDQTKHRAAILRMMSEFRQLGRATAGDGRLIELWEDWLRRAPTDVSALNSLAWWLSVVADEKLRDPARAVELARQAVALKPDVASYHNTFGTALYRADKLNEARVELERSLELKTTEPALDWYLLAAIAHRDGKLDEARQLFDRAAADHQQNHANNDDHDLLAAEIKALLLECEDASSHSIP